MRLLYLLYNIMLIYCKLYCVLNYFSAFSKIDLLVFRLSQLPPPPPLPPLIHYLIFQCKLSFYQLLHENMDIV